MCPREAELALAYRVAGTPAQAIRFSRIRSSQRYLKVSREASVMGSSLMLPHMYTTSDPSAYFAERDLAGQLIAIQ